METKNEKAWYENLRRICQCSQVRLIRWTPFEIWKIAPSGTPDKRTVTSTFRAFLAHQSECPICCLFKEPFQVCQFSQNTPKIEFWNRSNLWFFFQFFDYKNDRGDFRWEAFGLYIVLNEHGRGIIFRLNSSRRRDDAQKWKSHEVPLIYLQSGDYKWNPIDQQFFPR